MYSSFKIASPPTSSVRSNHACARSRLRAFSTAQRKVWTRTTASSRRFPGSIFSRRKATERRERCLSGAPLRDPPIGPGQGIQRRGAHVPSVVGGPLVASTREHHATL